MAGNPAKTHTESFLLLPFFHRSLEWIFSPSKPVAVRIGKRARRFTRIVGHAIPVIGWMALIMALVQNMAGVAGFEPAISGLGGRCIIQLCYTPNRS